MTLGFVFMASGFGRRFGSNKLLYPIDGAPLYTHALSSLIEAANELKSDNKINLAVVSQYDEILTEARRNNLIAVYNPDSCKGITASIELGINSLAESEHYAFFVADQPYLKAETTADFIKHYLKSGKTIGCVTDSEVSGSPVIFSREFLPELLALEGDRGGKQIVIKHPEDVFYYKVSSRELLDMDKPEDLDNQT
ncbi:MAG: nucleotidyltransferase family protein [Oscillospiraceae bacterium]|nr:nucleotidyltransferase family protein [Oscillospiraceae bacterium]